MTAIDAKHSFETDSVEATIELGACLGRVLAPGDTVGLVGALGSGKTHLVKGVAQGNAAPIDVVVNSPTFVLVNEYPGKLPLFHIDFYRLANSREAAALGIDEMIDSGGAVLIEWADRVPDALPPDRLWIDIGMTGVTCRRFTIKACGEASGSLLARFVADAA